MTGTPEQHTSRLSMTVYVLLIVVAAWVISGYLAKRATERQIADAVGTLSDVTAGFLGSFTNVSEVKMAVSGKTNVNVAVGEILNQMVQSSSTGAPDAVVWQPIDGGSNVLGTAAGSKNSSVGADSD